MSKRNREAMDGLVAQIRHGAMDLDGRAQAAIALAIADLADAVRELATPPRDPAPVDRAPPNPAESRYVASCLACEIYDVATDDLDIDCGQCRRPMRITLRCGCVGGCLCYTRD